MRLSPAASDTAHRHVPSSLHTISLTVLGRVPDMLPGTGYHCVRGTQRRHHPIPEPVQSAGCWSANGVQSGGLPPPLSASLDITPHEDMVAYSKW